jgi:hypothetical protein
MHKSTASLCRLWSMTTASKRIRSSSRTARHEDVRPLLRQGFPDFLG